MDVASNSPLDEATARSVVARVVSDAGASPEEAELCLAELLKFLDLATEMRKAGDDRALIPSPEVDAAWHALILHTRAYMDLCERRYGEYVHHEIARPDGSTPARDLFQYARTRVLMEKRYGGLDENLWPLP